MHLCPLFIPRPLDSTALSLQPDLPMHPFGLITLLQFLWEHGIPSLLVIGLLLSVVFLCRRDQGYQDAPATLPHFPLSHVTSFMKQRHDFFAWGFRVTNQRLFQFKLLRVCQILLL